MFNLFCVFSSFCCLLLDGVESGWFPVEKKGREEVFPEQNPTLWVLFFKELGSEKIGVRFPTDPIYAHKEDGSFEARCEREGERFELIVLKIGEKLPPLLEGEGIEHVIQTEDHVCYLRAYCLNGKSLCADDFFASFFAQKKTLN